MTDVRIHTAWVRGVAWLYPQTQRAADWMNQNLDTDIPLKPRVSAGLRIAYDALDDTKAAMESAGLKIERT